MSKPDTDGRAASGEKGYSLLRLVPPVLRARDFHLYTGGRGRDGNRGGGRLVDLWQNGGGAILGHKGPALLREFKNAANRGLLSPLPHPLEKRLVKALARLFPGRLIRMYGAGRPPEPYSLWRPFLDEEAPLAVPGDIPVLAPVLPGGASGPLILAIDPAFEKARPFPPSDLIAPAILAVLVRGVYDLIAAAPERGRPFPKIFAALSGDAWKRRGIYLFPAGIPAGVAWEALFRRFLAAGFLIPPDPAEPLILPGILSPGEEAALADLLVHTEMTADASGN